MDCSHRTVSRSGVAQIASSGLSATATLKASTHFRLLHLAPIARTAYAYSGLSLVNMVAVLKRLVRLLSSRGRHLQLDNPPAEIGNVLESWASALVISSLAYSFQG